MKHNSQRCNVENWNKEARGCHWRYRWRDNYQVSNDVNSNVNSDVNSSLHVHERKFSLSALKVVLVHVCWLLRITARFKICKFNWILCCVEGWEIEWTKFKSITRPISLGFQSQHMAFTSRSMAWLRINYLNNQKKTFERPTTCDSFNRYV